MKGKYILWLLFPLLVSCDDYLKDDSDDLLIPSSVNDYLSILIGEAYPDDLTYNYEQIHLMTDDVEMGPLYYDDAMSGRVSEGVDGMRDGEAPYTWGDITEDIWEDTYADILGCNVVINALPTMSYADEEYDLYCKLAAQAYTLRAYHYFCLINLYAAPWSVDNLDEPGVVMRVSPDVNTDAAPRATVGEIYALINDDLSKAEEYFVNARDQYMKWEISPEALYFLQARVALFQEDWDGVIAAAEKFFETGEHEIYDLNGVDLTTCGLPWTSSDSRFWINDADVSESIFYFGKACGSSRYYFAGSLSGLTDLSLGYHPSWEGEDALLNLYELGDLRRDVYFGQMFYQSGLIMYAYQAMPMKGQTVREAWRTPELYLNLAEAYARKDAGVSQEAIDLLNDIRVKKLTPEAYVAKMGSDFASQEELVRFIWEERRRELCFEEAMRFWDLRRQGMPEIVHRFYFTDGNYETYVLDENSPNYLLQIPAVETDYNSAIENNPRDIIVGQ